MGCERPIRLAKDDEVNLRIMILPIKEPATWEYPIIMLVWDFDLSYLSMIAWAAISRTDIHTWIMMNKIAIKLLKLWFV